MPNDDKRIPTPEEVLGTKKTIPRPEDVLKKKDDTISPLAQETTTGESATTEEKTLTGGVSSGVEKASKKAKAQRKPDKDFGSWLVEQSTDRQVKDKTEEKANTDQGIYSGYPKRENYEYKIVDGQWQWRMKASSQGTPNMLDLMDDSPSGPKYTPWKTVESSGRKDALDTYFLDGNVLMRTATAAQPREALEEKEQRFAEPEWEGPRPEDYMVTFGAKQDAIRDFSYQKDAISENIAGLTNQMQSELAQAQTVEQKQQVVEQFTPLIETEKEKLDAVDNAQAKNKEEFANLMSQPQPGVYDKKKMLVLSSIDENLAKMTEGQATEYLSSVFEKAGPEFDNFTFEEFGIGDYLRVTNTVSGRHRDFSLLQTDPERAKLEGELLKGFLNIELNSQKLYEEMGKVESIQQQIDELQPYQTVDRMMLDKELAAATTNMNIEATKRRKLAATTPHMAYTEWNSDKLQEVTDDITRIQLSNITLKNDYDEFGRWTKNAKDSYNKGLITQEEWDNVTRPSIEAEQASLDLRKYNNMAKTYQTYDKQSDLDIIAGLAYEANKDRGSTLAGISKEFTAGAGDVFRFLTGTEKGRFVDPELEGVTSDIDDWHFGIVTDEYLSSPERSDIQQVLFGLSRSIGAMATGTVMAPGAGTYAGMIGLFGSSYEDAQDMLSQAGLDNVPEGEKWLFSTIYAGTVASLERLGIGKAFSKTPLGKNMTSWIMSKAVRELPKGASAEMIDQSVKSSMSALITKGLIDITGAGLVEGTTEGLQEIADAGIKKAYNMLKGEKRFEEYETWGQFLAQVSRSTMLGMMGGTMMGTAGKAGRYTKDGFKNSGATPIEADMFLNMVSDPELKSAFSDDLKIKIMNGELTQEQAEQKLNEFDQASGIVQSIPKDTPREKVTEVFDLLVEKRNLEDEIKGVDKNLVQDKINRIAEIDESLLGAKGVTEEGTVKETKAPEKSEQLKAHEEHGGSSFTQEGENLIGKPGYSVSIYPERSKIIKGKEITDEQLEQYKEENKDLLEDPNNFVGTWYDAESDQTYLDISKRVEDQAEATKMAQEANQKAIFDLENLEEIDTGGTGEAVVTEEAPTPEPTKAKKDKLPPVTPEVAKGIIDDFKKLKKKKITINERTALKDQIILEARAAREGAKSEKQVRKDIADKIKLSLAKVKGVFSDRQTRSIVDRALKMNLSNPIMAGRFVDYVSKVAKDAEYDTKIKSAFAYKKRFKKPSKKEQAELRSASSEFATIDPIDVKNIDEYIDNAEKLKAAITSSRKTGGTVKMRDVSGVQDVASYTKEALEHQEEVQRERIKSEYTSLFDDGILNDKMSVSDMRDVIRSIGDADGRSISDDAKIREEVSNTYEAYAGIIEDMLKTGKDPFTGESILFTKDQKSAISSLLKVDIDKLSLRELFDVVDMLSNFASNRAIGNVQSTANYFLGKQNTGKYFKKHGKAKKMNTVIRGFDYHIASLPVMIDTMLTGVGKSIDFMSYSGLSDLTRGASSAQRIATNITNEYAKRFGKRKPNKERFNTAKNSYERGMISFLSRNVIGSETDMNQEFLRRVRIINESIDYLTSKDASKKENKKGLIYKELQEKLGLETENITLDQIKSKADKINVEATDWWVDKWSEYKDDLSSVSLSIYNKELSPDFNYTPDRYKKKASADRGDIEEMLNGAFGQYNDYIYNKESSSLMSANKPKVLPTDRVIDLDFDLNNHTMIEAAIVDMKTAEAIRKVHGFTRSSDFNKIFDPEDAKVLNQRIANYILRVRKKEVNREEQNKVFKQITNTLAKAGTTLTLGGIDQIPKQTLSVAVNTMVNSGGRLDIAKAMSKEANEWINNSDMPIAGRGIQAEANIDVAEKNLDKAVSGAKRILKTYNDLTDSYLKAFLVNPDRFVARASFISYYKQNLSSRGLSTDINFNEKMDKKAADYAQHMVDRQQNISDPMLAGEMFQDRTWSADLAKKMLFPFANFIMNQKSRMYADVRTLTTKTGNTSDKIMAYKSLAGLATEIIVFQMVSLILRETQKEVARNIVGYEPSEEDYKVNQAVNEENRKRKLQGKKPMTNQEESAFRVNVYREEETKKRWKTFWTQVVTDMLSPAPPLDFIVIKGFNEVAIAAQLVEGTTSKEANEAVKVENLKRKDRGDKVMSKSEESEFREEFATEEAFKLWDFEPEGRNWGVLGIYMQKREEYNKAYLAASEGKIITERDGKKTTKYLLPEDQEVAKWNEWATFLYLWGVVPADIGKEARYIQKNLEKSALTKNQMEAYNEVKKLKGGGKVTAEELRKIKKNVKPTNIVKQKSDLEGVSLEGGSIEGTEIEGVKL